MRVELFANQRLLDTYKHRGRVAKRKRDEKPKEYPLAGEDWSSQDESEESQDETEAKEINPATHPLPRPECRFFGRRYP